MNKNKPLTKGQLKTTISEQKETITKLEKQIKEQNDQLNEFKYRLLLISVHSTSKVNFFNPNMWPSQKIGWGDFPFPLS